MGGAPDRLPVLPLRDVIVFPHVVTPLLVGRPASLAALDAASADDPLVLLVAQRRGEVQDPASADLYRVGVVARLLQAAKLQNATTKVLVEGVARARVTRYAPAGTHLRASIVLDEPTPADDPAEEHALSRRLLSLFEEYIALGRRLPPEVLAAIASMEGEGRKAYAVAAHLGVRIETKQSLLEAPSIPDLLRRVGEALSLELELLRLERKIEDDVRGSVAQTQREYYLQEQLKAIHRELGEEEADDIAELQAQLEQRGLPEPVLARAMREVRRLRKISPLSPESSVARTYIEWLAALPWTQRTDEMPDVSRAETILDEDHYGLAEVKDRILDHIAALALAGRLEGPILCLVGPPGVGKTSLGRSIARALGRKFVRMSLGGVRDEAEIRGHRRTYIGAMPGRVIQAMRRAEVVNPVILLDEVDKLGRDIHGDPASALLEVLDPEQHRAFNDHYLEVDYDLSQVLFITTANSLGGIPEPLRDRMEIIRLAGYLDQEKFAIAERFLIPRQMRMHGLEPARVRWAGDAVPAIVHGWTREAGVRDLERRIARVSRKLARRVAVEGTQEETSLEVTAAELPALLGPPPHETDPTELEDKIGVATGLAYTPVGGEVLEIEVSAVHGRGKLQLTGTLGDVMKESASAALSYARARADVLGIARDFHRTRDLHVHIPTGATPKDGPSAGIAIASAIVSALTGVPVRGDIAMTGEVTLRGRVLPIGGLKEKAVAAHRNRLTHVVIPRGNLRDVEELPPEVRSAVRFHPVRSMDEVLALVLRASPGASRSAAAAAVVAH